MKRPDCVRQLVVGNEQFAFYDITLLEEQGVTLSRLPFSIKILVENILRHQGEEGVSGQDLVHIAGWQKKYAEPVEIPLHPARVLMQDFTGVPAVVDLAAMRDALQTLGGDPQKINPVIPVDLIVDHSVQVDHYGSAQALSHNVEKEYQRNAERYAFLKWAQKSFDNFNVVPPNSGICHQVNLEYLAQVVMAAGAQGKRLLYPDTLVGTDSHTTMVNGIGVMGWGVGGIEAEAVMLGQPYFMAIPEVIGVRLVNALPPKVTATDLVLTITEKLRGAQVVDKFVEFFGPGMTELSVTDRATIANMSPEYGATMGFFPVDAKTIAYLEMTNRQQQARITEVYCKRQGLFYSGEITADYTDIIEIDLAAVVPCLAGPSRPQDRIALPDVKKVFGAFVEGGRQKKANLVQLSQFFDESGCVTCRDEVCLPCADHGAVDLTIGGQETCLADGSIVIAAITSCTNTSNPAALVGAALLARNAGALGLRVPVHVKTTLAPGSKVASRYLEDAGLLTHLENLGFYLAGFGCTTCIGNSGPLPDEVDRAISEHNLTVAAVLSGNRNFEARIHQQVKANFLASPMLVVAFALCGRIDVDLTCEPLGADSLGNPVFLDDIWPQAAEIDAVVRRYLGPELFAQEYAALFSGDNLWRDLPVPARKTFNWQEDSSYIRKPPYFENFVIRPAPPGDVAGARALIILGDSVTTDHISPAGAIPPAYPAGAYLLECGISPEAFNSYGSRRGNHEVMLRGTFANIRLRNKIVGDKVGSYTRKFPEGDELFVYEAARRYQEEGTPLIVLAGKEYGTGSSRDWAAKGTRLLGVKAVIARSYERIHRSNLVGMGVLPLQFGDGESWQSLGLDGSEVFAISGITAITSQKILKVRAAKKDGQVIAFTVLAKLNSAIEVKYFQHGGILPAVLRRLRRSG
ncbi:MAG: aconitate hydratase AcnA [Proteobacteria bacterium]|nr:aconitate hydratase AcnA [Pseudomonadota bacterium]MBU1640624.1 aconitate hydratase AcnA [Pseudomonadota bacterium]